MQTSLPQWKTWTSELHFRAAACFLSLYEDILEFVQVNKPLQVTVCVFQCGCRNTSSVALWGPQGQKSKERECIIIIIILWRPEKCVNMDTMEMHYAIMAGFMHFSLAGGAGGVGD